MAGNESTTAAESAHHDIVVVGAGMVGALFAAALAESSELRIAVLESAYPEPFQPGSDPAYDLRVSALSLASQHMLERVGAWAGIVSRRACPYSEMLVWDGEAGGRTRFRAESIGKPLLGHIVENRVTQLALLEVLEAHDNIALYCPATLESLDDQADGVTLGLSDGRRLTADLVVAADGGRSRVRELVGIDSIHHDYRQHALVATVATAKPQQSVTWQRFVPSGPEAMLPLLGARASLVWYHTPEEVARLTSLEEDAFTAELEARFPRELGAIEAVVERGSFPILRSHARRYFDGRVVLIGDAAHTVHPLAGQGVNLGLLDAGALAEILADAVTRGHSIASARELRRYERWRRGENELMLRVLDGFQKAFGPQPRPLRMARSALLDAADVLTPVKHRVMRQAMGIAGDLPRLAKAHPH